MEKRTIDGHEAEIEDGVIETVDAINDFEGLRTVGSCEGHDDQNGGQPGDEWFVAIKPDRSEHGWFDLEFLSWVVSDFNRGNRGEGRIELSPHSAPPYLNEPGNTMYFALIGRMVDQAEFARQLQKRKDDCYIGPEMSSDEVEQKMAELFN